MLMMSGAAQSKGNKGAWPHELDMLLSGTSHTTLHLVGDVACFAKC